MVEIKNLLNRLDLFIKLEDENFSFSKKGDNLTQLLMGSTKLNADVGELNKHILKYLDLETKYKLKNFKNSDLENSLIEVLFQILLISKLTNMDLNSAIKRKIDVLDRIIGNN